jgi:predicted small lipoprotein YifL
MKTALVTITLFMTLTTLAACVLDDADDLSPESDTAISARVTNDESVGRNGQEAEIFDAKSLQSAGSCGFHDPPRCDTPRNCVAWCISCLYDICRLEGKSCEQCRGEMEACKVQCDEDPGFGQ